MWLWGNRDLVVPGVKAKYTPKDNKLGYKPITVDVVIDSKIFSCKQADERDAVWAITPGGRRELFLLSELRIDTNHAEQLAKKNRIDDLKAKKRQLMSEIQKIENEILAEERGDALG